VPGLLNTSSMLMCPHGGTVTSITTNVRVKVGGDFAVRQSDTSVIAGCPFLIGLVPHPCVKVNWVQPAARSKVARDPTLTEASMGLCVAADEAVQGPVQVIVTQQQVTGI
jgi:hypothetical protein